MTDEQLRQLVESNARAIQAMLDARAEERQEFQLRLDRLDNIVERLANLQEGMARMLASLDEDRPTIIRRLSSIENKVDRLLEREQQRDEQN